MSEVAAIALGSNLNSPAGDSPKDGRAANLRGAIHRLEELGRVTAVSSFHDTAPVGYLDQPRFLNAALLLETSLAPLDLLGGLLAIERAMGRDRSGMIAKGPRIIDLDIIFFGSLVLKTATLTIPHPAMRERRFVLEPLEEIAPDLVDPVTSATVAALLAAV